MALNPKQGKPFINRTIEFQDAYLVVDMFTENNKKKKTATFSYYIFPKKEARTDIENCLDSGPITATGEDYDNHFSPSAITADDNEFKQAYLYMLSLTDDEGNLVWGDNWESDE